MDPVDFLKKCLGEKKSSNQDLLQFRKLFNKEKHINIFTELKSTEDITENVARCFIMILDDIMNNDVKVVWDDIYIKGDIILLHYKLDMLFKFYYNLYELNLSYSDITGNEHIDDFTIYAGMKPIIDNYSDKILVFFINNIKASSYVYRFFLKLEKPLTSFKEKYVRYILSVEEISFDSNIFLVMLSSNKFNYSIDCIYEYIFHTLYKNETRENYIRDDLMNLMKTEKVNLTGLNRESIEIVLDLKNSRFSVKDTLILKEFIFNNLNN